MLKTGGKTAGKSVAKKLPFGLGLATGGFFGAIRLFKGDFTG